MNWSRFFVMKEGGHFVNDVTSKNHCGNDLEEAKKLAQERSKADGLLYSVYRIEMEGFYNRSGLVNNEGWVDVDPKSAVTADKKLIEHLSVCVTCKHSFICDSSVYCQQHPKKGSGASITGLYDKCHFVKSDEPNWPVDGTSRWEPFDDKNVNG